MNAPARRPDPRQIGWHIQVAAALRRVVGALEERGIPCLPVKGALLAHQVYARFAERPLTDADLLVRPRDFLRCLRVAHELGLRTVWDSRQLGNVNLVSGGVSVDLASSIGPPGTCGFGVARVLSRAERAVAPLGFPHWQIEWHDHALLVALDAFKDKLGAKPHSREDLARIGASPRFDSRAMLARAREARLETMLAVVVAWLAPAERSAWDEVRRGLASRPIRRRYAHRYLHLAGQRGPHVRGFALGLAARAVCDDPCRRAWAVGLGAAGTALQAARARVAPDAVKIA